MPYYIAIPRCKSSGLVRLFFNFVTPIYNDFKAFLGRVIMSSRFSFFGAGLGFLLFHNYSHLPQMTLLMFLIGCASSLYFFYYSLFSDEKQINMSIQNLKDKRGIEITEIELRLATLMGSFSLGLLMVIFITS